MNAEERYEAVESFQNLLVAYATGGSVDAVQFAELRNRLIAALGKDLPRFVRTCSDIKQFWAHMKQVSPTYQGRREYLWNEFRPLLQALQAQMQSPGDSAVAKALATFDPRQVPELWQRALERRTEDPEGAITLARTLLETVCKYILDRQGIAYPGNADLPILYRLAAGSLNLAPSQQSAKILKQVFGGATAVVEGLGALRSRLGDAHGKGPGDPQPLPRHAQLAVNLAGALATFLCETFAERGSRVP